MKSEAMLPHRAHSWMEKKGMLEGRGMMAAPGTGWQEANVPGFRESVLGQEELSCRHRARGRAGMKAQELC